MKKQAELSPFMRVLGVLLALWTPFITAPVAFSATLFWDADGTATGNNATTGAGLGGTGSWDNLSTVNWWDGVSASDVTWNNSGINTAVFEGTGGTVTLNAPITAGGLVFNSNGFNITGTGANILTLASGSAVGANVNVGTGFFDTISAAIAGSSGLGKIGGGTLRLTGANTYTGTTGVYGGILSINSASALGGDTSTVTVFGNTNSGGGTLMLSSGGNVPAFTLARNLFLSGYGAVVASSTQAGTQTFFFAQGALANVGNNTVSGNITTSSVLGTRIVTDYGNLSLTGGLALGAGNTFQIGTSSGNTTLPDNIIISGQISGGTTGNLFQKFGNGTVVLTNAANNFASYVQIDTGFVRVDSGAELGANTTSGANASIQINGGTLEVRTDTPGAFSTKNVNFSTNGTIFVSRAVGGSGLGTETLIGGVPGYSSAAGNVVFGILSNTANNNTETYSGRDGYGVTVGTGAIVSLTAGNPINFTNSGNGVVTLNAILSATDTTARAYTFTATGDMVLTGSLLGTGGAHVLTKAGTGELVIQGAASTYTGGTNINAGTLAISSFGTLNGAGVGNTLHINNGALNYNGLGETTTMVVDLSGTTGGAVINANQTSGALVFSSAFTASGAGIKTLTLGGTNNVATFDIHGAVVQANTIAAAIVNNSGTNTTGVTKNGSGTWVLTGANTYTGATTITNGTLIAVANAAFPTASTTLASTTNLVFNVDTASQSAGGTFNYISNDSGSIQQLGQLISTAGAGTVQVTNTGAYGFANGNTLTFSSLAAANAGATLNVTTSGSGISGTDFFVNFTTSPGTGYLNARTFVGGANFAFYDTTTGAISFLRALNYGVDANTAADPATFAAAAGNAILLDSSSTLTGTPAGAIESIKFTGGANLTLTGGTLTLNNGGTTVATTGGILVTGSQSIISGGLGITTGGAGDLVVRVDQLNDSLTLSTPVTNTTTGGITKSGLGLLILNAVNAQTGTTTINEGTLQLLGATSTLGSANDALTIRQNATLDLNGVSAAAGAFNGAGTVTNSNGATAATLTIGNNTGTGTFTGLIQDGALVGGTALTKTGTGTIYLNNQNTYSGATNLNGGILAVTTLANFGSNSGIGTGNAAAGNAASLIFNGGTLQYTGSNSIQLQATQTPSIAINRLFTLAGNGAIDSSGTYGNSILANGAANNAALWFNNTAAVAFSGTGARTLTLTGSSIGGNEIDLQLIDNPGGGALSVTKTSANTGVNTGLWVLGGVNNTYSGATTITNGVLRAQDGTSLSAASNLVFNSTTAGNNTVLESTGVFTRALGTGAGQISWNTNASGGFAGGATKLTVNLGGAGAQVNWGAGGIGNGTGALIFGSATSLSEVEFQNAINLGTAITTTRTIQVDDNTTTTTDFATVSGAISGSAAAGVAALTKTGGGVLVLTGANTFTGGGNATAGTGGVALTNGALVINSFAGGGSLGAVSGLIGTADTNRLVIGAAGATAQLIYVGAGETVNRTIEITGNGGISLIESDGTGPLVINNLLFTNTGAQTFYLRGTNIAMNQVAANITNNGANVVTVQKNDAGFWLLSGNNSYTGGTTLNNGVLGISSNTALGTGTLTAGNASLETFGQNLTLANAVTISGANLDVSGAYSLTFTGVLTNINGNSTLNNFLASIYQFFM